MNPADQFLSIGIVDEDKWECAVCLSLHGNDSEFIKYMQCDANGPYAICGKCREMGKERAVQETISRKFGKA